MSEKTMQGLIQDIVNEVQIQVCDNLCKCRESADEDLICDYMREHEGECPMDLLL